MPRPTDQPLYAYKTSDEEYGQIRQGLAGAAADDPMLAACFVLYAAEWWRRNHQGGTWEWQPIFDEINRSCWNTATRRQSLVQAGFTYWQRPVFRHESGENAYLGTIFAESGIPTGLLNKDTHLNNLILDSFKEAQAYRCENLFETVRKNARSTALPQPLLTEPFFELIVKVVEQLAALKKDYNLGAQANPLNHLETHDLDWRDRFPLRIDDHPAARDFLDQILTDTAKLQRPQAPAVNIAYQLQSVDNGWRIITKLVFPDGCHAAPALGLNPERLAALPDMVAVTLIHHAGERLLGYGHKNGRSELSVRNLTVKSLPHDLHTRPWSLVLGDAQCSAPMPLPYADGLPADMPWVFAEKDGQWQLRAVGSARLNASRVRVVCPAHFSIEGEGCGKLCAIGETQALYEATANCTFHDQRDSQHYNIRLNEPTEEDRWFYTVRPKDECWIFPFLPHLHTDVYLGFPRLYRMRTLDDFRVSVPETRIEYRTAGSQWQPLPNPVQLLGRFRIRCVGRDGETLFARQIAVLPEGFGVSYGQSELRLRHSGAFSLEVAPPEGVEITRHDDGHRVRFMEDAPKDRLTTRLIGGNAQPIELRLPAPGRAAFFSDKDGRTLPNSTSVDVRGLHGTALVLANPTDRRQNIQIELTLEKYHADPPETSLRQPFTIEPFGTHTLPLYRLGADIARLLAFTDSVDSQVRIQTPDGTRLYVKQYTHHTHFDRETRLITLRDAPASTLPLRAFPLSERFAADKVVDLTPTPEGWFFPPEADLAAKWFYFSAKDASAQIRPSVAVLAPVEENQNETVKQMHQAADHSYQNREKVLKQLFDAMATDFGNDNWQVLAKLHECTAHLPFNALDQWKALAKSKRGLAAFFLQFPIAAVERFSREFWINWNRIPVTVWIEVAQAWMHHWQPALGSHAANAVGHKLTELEKIFGMDSLARLMAIEVLNQEADSQLRPFGQANLVQNLMESAVFGQEGKAGLLTRHGKQRLPTHLGEELCRTYAALPEHVRKLVPAIPPQHTYAKPLVLLPVVLACHSVYPSAVSLSNLNPHKTMLLMEFDKDFFDYLFNLTQAHCWLTQAHCWLTRPVAA